MANPVIHFEILGRDGASLIEFYRTLFGWSLDEMRLPGWPHYGLMEEPDAGIGGAVGSADAAPSGGVVLYVEVDDLHAYVERATAMGATVALPITEVAGTKLAVAWLQDPQGNVIGLVKTGDH